MFDVFLLLPVPRWFFESFDDEGGGRGDDGNGSLAILDCELDRNP